MMTFDTIWLDAGWQQSARSPGLGVIERGALREGCRIAFAGATADLPTTGTQAAYCTRRPLITPGLIDCHTHLVLRATRARFELRLAGASYEEIARPAAGSCRP